MSLPNGARLGPYEVIAPIGAGGMGEVYRARDTKLNRDVALKVLPEALAGDPDRLARFRREAQVLASLNHPNIAHLYGFEDAAVSATSGGGGTAHALVMELVEGPTLADRIAQGAIPLGDALAIAKQIADALDAAHEQGIIHRDLKPANVKVRDDGTVKVLDFGLAKALTAEGPNSATDAMHSPTMTARATEMGMILGTAAYMAPEQAKGKTVDRRADVWAFGVVLFEMITGRQLFTGESASEVMASVMKEEPDWSRLPANFPAPLRRLLRRCLEKDPKKRLSSISDARLELGEQEGAAEERPAPATGASRLWLAGAAVSGAVVTAVALLLVAPALRSTPDREPTRVSVLGPDSVSMFFDSSESAISPDGRRLVFTGVDRSGAFKLWIRPLGELESRPLAGTEDGRLPFWSPDSRQVAFFAGGKLKKVPVAGGTTETLAEAKDGRGGAWGAADVIVFAPSNNGPLLSVSANGGEPKAATALDEAKGETGHRFPWFLPDGRHFLFAAIPERNQKHDLYVGSLDGPARQPVGSSEGSAVYADPGYLLFARGNALVAQRFDAGRLELSGEPIAIGDVGGSLGAQFSASRAVSVSATGALAYLGDKLGNTKLVWFDRTGRELGPVEMPDGRYAEVSFAPDLRRAAVVRYASGRESDIWIADLERGGATRFTFGPALQTLVHWSHDGNRIVFAGDREGPRDIFIKPASGATPEEPLFTSKAPFKDPSDWSADGKFIVFDQLDAKTNRDVWLLPVDGDRKPTVYMRTPFNEQAGVISPDGRWMAYSSDESGRFEIYVDSFPTPRRKYRVTTAGGAWARWRKDSKELVVLSLDGRSVLLADVLPGAEFTTATPRQALTLPPGTVWIEPTFDAQKFLVAVPVVENTTSSITVVFDWASALKKK